MGLALAGAGVEISGMTEFHMPARIFIAAALAAHAITVSAFVKPALEVSHRARAIHPGEVVVLEVRAPAPPAEVSATAFGHEIRFFQDASDGVWRGLVGIDLTTEPGSYEVTVRAFTAGGGRAEIVYALDVAPKDFPTRHLKVAPSFVNPPPEVVERILREQEETAAIFRGASPERLWRGGFARPVPGKSTSSFGRRSVYNGEPRSPHSGADFRAGKGVAIKAPNAANVALTGDLYFSGKVVILDHGWGLYSYFAHLSAIDVVEGDVVQRGDVVGRVGATGRVTGPHLHWTVRLNDARVDPLALMELLPSS